MTRTKLKSHNGPQNIRHIEVPLFNLPELKLRFLCPSDVPEIKVLCQQWFPIEYPDGWYKDITTNAKFYSLAAIFKGVIVGLLVAETKHVCKINSEDQDIFPSYFGISAQIGYILTLGVSERHRRKGIASLLLDSYLKYLDIHESDTVQAILLHVLTTNYSAIDFYEKKKFERHAFLPYFYNIGGKPRDGFSYVLYVNGGYPSAYGLEYISRLLTLPCISYFLWSPIRLMYRTLCMVGHMAVTALTTITS